MTPPEEQDSHGTITQEIARIVAQVERMTGLRSRWNGSVTIWEAHMMQTMARKPFLAKKTWDCGITVVDSLLDDDRRWRTLIHEALHSVSAGMNERDYGRFLGWEEGTVEWLQRHWRPQILLSLDVNMPEDRFAAPERAWPLNGYLDALETLRTGCGQEPEFFYRTLLRTPLARRLTVVQAWGKGPDAADFFSVFARTIGRLR